MKHHTVVYAYLVSTLLGWAIAIPLAYAALWLQGASPPWRAVLIVSALLSLISATILLLKQYQEDEL